MLCFIIDCIVCIFVDHIAYWAVRAQWDSIKTGHEQGEYILVMSIKF